MAPKQEIFHLHPSGWENDPEQESFPLSILDYLPPSIWNNYMLFFRLDDKDKDGMISLLKAGLERTLSQTRHLCGTIEKDTSTGEYVFLKRRESTVQLHVQWLDADPAYPSFDDLESSHFGTAGLKDISLWSIPSMMHGIKPEAEIDNHPVIVAFKASLVRGGLVFTSHIHHCSNDVMGWASFVHQLADNCHALHHKTAFPPWDPACLDRSFLNRQIPEEAMIDAPPRPGAHPDIRPVELLLFHLPASKAAALKTLATPPSSTDPDVPWISTFDAFTAFIWRTTLRLRHTVFNADPASTKVEWGAPVNMRRRLSSCPPRAQGNILFVGARAMAPLSFVLDRPLPEVAAFIRRLTSSATEAALHKQVDGVARIRNKSALSLRPESLPPLSFAVTDWRETDVASADFGPAAPVALRQVSEDVIRCFMTVYPPRAAPAGSDEGCEFAIAYEKDLAKELIEDPEWNKYFEYRGVL